MNTKKRFKILLTLAVVAGISAVSLAMTVPATPYGSETRVSMYSYSGGASKVDLHITDAVTDVNDLSIRWTGNRDTDPNYTMTYTQVDPADPNIWEITLTKSEEVQTGGYWRWDAYAWVTDDNGEVRSDRTRIYVYDDACTAAKEYAKYTPSATVGRPLATDFNQDCITNFLDLVDLATAWLEDFTPTGPFPAP